MAGDRHRTANSNPASRVDRAAARTQGEVSEVYRLEGDTLRLDHGTYAGSEATWRKQPMNKCE